MPLPLIDTTLLAIAAPFAVAIIAPFVIRVTGGYSGWLLAVVPALLCLHFFRFLPDVADNLAHAGGFDWAWQINVRFSYLIDGLSLMFALLITMIGAVIVVSAGASLSGHPRQGRFFCLMFLLMGSALGLVLADDFLMLFILWEMTAIAGCLLVGIDHDKQAARRAAWLALIVPVAGGLPLLAGFLILIGFLGVPSMSDAIALGNTFGEHPAYLSVLALVLAGAFAKSAQFPFPFWLTNTAAAPAPAAAYMQSAALAPAGVYLLMRVHPFLGDTPAWSIVLPVAGGLTLLTGAVLALRQNELRLLLSHVSVAILGLCVMLLGTSLPLAILAALGFLLAHALSMSALLLATGAIADRVGATDINGLRGLARAIPLTCAAIVVAAMTMAGAPGTPGYWAMTLAQDALFSPNPLAQILLALLIPAIALVAAAVIAVVLTPFFRMDGAPAKTAREEPPGIWFGPVILSFGAIVMIVFGAWTGKYLLDPAHLAIALRLGNVGNPPGIHLDAIFAIAAATWILAAVICWARWGRRIQMPRWQPYAEYTAGFAGAVFVAGISLWALVRLSSEFMTGAELRSAGQLQGAAILAMIAAPLIALVRADLRWLFACLIISGLGSVAAGVALGSPIGLAGALAFAIQFPAIITGLLVTVRAARRTCGLPRRKAGERFCGASPILAAVTAVFMFALAGLPPFSGFWPRVILTQAALLEARWWLAAAFLLGGLLILLAAARTFAAIIGTDRPAANSSENLTTSKRLFIFVPPIALAALTILLGVWPAILVSITDRSVAALLAP